MPGGNHVICITGYITLKVQDTFLLVRIVCIWFSTFKNWLLSAGSWRSRSQAANLKCPKSHGVILSLKELGLFSKARRELKNGIGINDEWSCFHRFHPGAMCAAVRYNALGNPQLCRGPCSAPKMGVTEAGLLVHTHRPGCYLPKMVLG